MIRAYIKAFLKPVTRAVVPGSGLKFSFTSANVFNAAENQTAVGTVEVNISGAVFSIITGIDSAKFSINANTGVLTFQSVPDYEVPTDTFNPVFDENGNAIQDENGDFILEETGNSDNVYHLVIQATKGSLTSTQTIAVTVLDVYEIQPEITTYITGLATPLSAGQITKLNTFVTSVKAGMRITNLSDAFDVMYILGGETEESSLRNLVKNAHHCTAYDSPAFTALEGFTGNGTSTYLNTNYNANTEGEAHTLDSASLRTYSRTVRAASAAKIIAGTQDGAANITRLFLLRDGTNGRGQINAGTGYVSGNVQNSLGLLSVIRSSSTTIHLVKNNNNFINATVDSIDVPNNNIYLLAGRASASFIYDDIQVSFGYAGRALTKPEHDALFLALEAYMDSNGKGVVA